MTAALRVLLAVLVLGALGAPAFAQAPGGAYRAEPLAEGVFVLRPTAPGLGRTNSLVVEQAGGLLVVEAQPSPDAASELLEAIRELSPAPLRYLVLSHAHAEVAGGAAAFPDSTLVVASTDFATLVADPQHDHGAELRLLAPDPAAWTPPPRREPTLLLTARAVLDDARNPVEILLPSRAHALGNLVVHLPRSGIVYLGDLLLVDRVPWTGDGSIDAWLGILNQFAKLAPERVVPLHGAPVDAGALRRLRDALAWLRGQVATGFVDQLPPAGIADRVLRDPEIERWFPVREPDAFLDALVKRVVDEAIAERVKRGIEE